MVIIQHQCQAGEFSQKAWAGYVREFSKWDFHSLQLSRQENLGFFFHLPAGRLYFWLNYIMRCSRGHITGVFYDPNQIPFILANLGSKASIGSF